MSPEEMSRDALAAEVRRLSAALAEQQRATADLRAKVEALCDESDRRAVPGALHVGSVDPADLRAALAAAPSGEQRKEGQR